MDRRLLLPMVLVLGCAQGDLEGPGSFGLPNTTTLTTTQADTEDDDGETEDDTDDGDGDGDTGPSTQSSTDPATEDASTSTPVTTAEDSSGDGSTSPDDSASASASAEESSSTDPIDPTDATNDDGAMDDGVEPPPDAGAWGNCEAAVCELGNDCITVNGVVGDAYCAPQCATDLDCPFPDSGDATPMCLLVGEGAVDPTNCTLVCEVDGLDYGTCPNGMTCTSVPGQDPTVSLCMW